MKIIFILEKLAVYYKSRGNSLWNVRILRGIKSALLKRGIKSALKRGIKSALRGIKSALLMPLKT